MERSHESLILAELANVSEVPLTSERSESSNLKKQESRQTVLLVEDDPSAREAMVEMISLWGYDVVAVGTAEEAEYAVKRRVPDAALIDVFLPGKSGASLMSRLRARFPDATLIGMSALGDAEMSRRCKGQGADQFLEKPISMESLAKALQTRRVSWH